MEKMQFAYAYVMSTFAAPKKDEKGATAVEYGLLVALIAAVIVAIVAALGTEIEGGFRDVRNRIANA